MDNLEKLAAKFQKYAEEDWSWLVNYIDVENDNERLFLEKQIQITKEIIGRIEEMNNNSEDFIKNNFPENEGGRVVYFDALREELERRIRKNLKYLDNEA